MIHSDCRYIDILVRFWILGACHSSMISCLLMEVPNNLKKMFLRLFGTVLLTSVASLLLIPRGRNWKLSILLKWMVINQEQDHSEDQTYALLKGREMMFSFRSLKRATGNFCSENKLGEGGFGSVYKGKTSDGRELAVKRLSVHSRQDESSFFNEVNALSNVQHRNLVRLLGCCAEGRERLLVYEYVPNKSLDRILFDPARRKHLDWQKRYRIIQGIARGLLYLHEDSQLRIIHRDIKISNILLDEKLCPKIADFGLAKLFPDDETHVSTKIAGTMGYMAPEYMREGQLSEAADVFSFGVLLLEIVAGRKIIDIPRGSNSKGNLLELAWRLHKKRCTADIIDPALGQSYAKEEVLRCIQIGLLCTQAQHIRPTMSRVVLMLSSNADTLPDPAIPAFIEFAPASVHAPLRNSLMCRSFRQAAKLFRYQACTKLPIKLSPKFRSHICATLPSTRSSDSMTEIE